MDLDSSYIEPMVLDLVKDFQEALKSQERLVKAKNEFYMPFVAIPAAVVNNVFRLADRFDLTAETKYMAIHLYDKYLCNHFWEVYKAGQLCSDRSEKSWQRTCKKISASTKLYLMSCLQLASKMVSNATSLDVPSIQEALRLMNDKHEYSKNAIFSSEFKVFKTVDFRMPHYTPYHCVEILLAATELKETPHMHDVCLCLLDSAYLQHEKLYLHLESLIGEKRDKGLDRRKMLALKSNYLFLGAGVVLCGAFCLCIEEETTRNIAVKLMNLVDIKCSDIWDFANILLMLSIQE